MRTAAVRHYGRKMAFHVVRCAHCDLVYVNPRPDTNEIRAYYPSQYQADMRQMLHEGLTNPVVRAGLEMVRHRRTPPVAAVGRVLDIGCSSGTYLAGLRQRGWEVQGLEIDPEAAEYARTQGGLPVQTGNAEDVLPGFPEASFDVVTMWHVLEHFFDPARVLTEVCRILKPGGFLMLELPNFRCPLAALFGEYWFPLEPPRHLYHFTPQTLEAMLARVGLRLVKLRGVPSPEAIVWSLGAWRNRRVEKVESDGVSLNPVWMGVCFPVSWVMAQFGLSDHMAALAVKPPATA